MRDLYFGSSVEYQVGVQSILQKGKGDRVLTENNACNPTLVLTQIYYGEEGSGLFLLQALPIMGHHAVSCSTVTAEGDLPTSSRAPCASQSCKTRSRRGLSLGRHRQRTAALFGCVASSSTGINSVT